MMQRVIIIPARIASRRLPGKMLLDQTGWPLIRHVYTMAQSVPGVSRVVVATDGPEISEVVKEFGGESVETSPDLVSGTDRVAEACRLLGLEDDQFSEDTSIVNVQGDEPELDPGDVVRLFEVLEGSPDCAAATLVTRHTDSETEAAFRDPNRVKVILDERGRARYFSRQPIPFCEQGQIPESGWLQHIGIYGFRPSSLRIFTSLPVGGLESQERLEQLRLLEFGHEIAVGEVSGAAPGIDTQEDYQRFVEKTLRMREDAGS
ncbi:3-deoxy-D-manno-octulosonate cytidylyltransferase [bacterium TMED181]|nr:3-deoxy-manno-octulosonate cytidylyltransferase [Planctomycetota bacterium]OUW46921.1 MAG: 3-deoxy-D-manno-octulosonate cytidylyltransferase [bacterium TMED181]